MLRIEIKELRSSNFTSSEWSLPDICKLLLRKLTNHPAWWFGIRGDNFFETNRQLKDEKFVTYNEKLIEAVTDCDNKIIKDLERRGHLFQKQLNDIHREKLG